MNDFVKGLKDGISAKGLGLLAAGFLFFMALAFFGWTPESTAAKARAKFNA